MTRIALPDEAQIAQLNASVAHMVANNDGVLDPSQFLRFLNADGYTKAEIGKLVDLRTNLATSPHVVLPDDVRKSWQQRRASDDSLEDLL